MPAPLLLPSTSAFAKKAPLAAPDIGPGYGFISGNYYPILNTPVGSGVLAQTGTHRSNLNFVMFTVRTAHKFTTIWMKVVTRSIAGAKIRLGVYSDVTLKPVTLLHTWGQMTGLLGAHTIAITWTPTPGRYWLCAVQQGGATRIFVLSGSNNANTWMETTLGATIVPNTINDFANSGWVSTTKNFTGSLPSTAPALSLITSSPGIFLKAA